MISFNTITPEVEALCLKAQRCRYTSPIERDALRKTATTKISFPPEQRKAALIISGECFIDPMRSDTLRRASGALPDLLFTSLILACGCRLGFETIEREMGLIPRSARQMLFIALRHLIQKNVVVV